MNYTAEITVAVAFTLDFEADSDEQAEAIAEEAVQAVHDDSHFVGQVTVDGVRVDVCYSGPDSLTVEEVWTDDEPEDDE